MKSWYKKAQTDEDLAAFRNERTNSPMGDVVRSHLKDFASVDVRRLHGIFHDFQDLSKQAEAEMDKWLSEGENNITIEEAEKRLSYYLARLGLK